ncbi:uncharacterized protein LOC127765887 isoform X3 [Oryza glaberrima]|uniref:uncharacterized protein LOC127765887 isoform X3 n=1 Tax=Oryza glaberrima TaxID=4538 RepID=UPI00224C4818|nr:uncharacterized protein LOC127765887 isoform X3 [Oryza glaberrima]
MKKKKTIDLKSLWERSAKSQKIASTTVPKPLTIESEVQISQNVPSNPIQLLLEAPSAHDSDTSPSVQVEKEETNPSTQPNRAASPATGPRTESSPLSPISDDGDDDDDGIYDVDLLPRDPAHRTPISSYDVNKQDAVRRGFVALGPFQPDHEFPQRDIGAQARRIVEALDVGDIETGTGLNQEMGLSRPGDTRWGSHYKTVMHVISLYPSIRQVLFKVGKDKSQNAEAIQAQTMLESFESFEFIFMAHLLLAIFGYSDDLSNALQKRDQDIVNAIELIYDTKMQLQLLREDDGWESFLKDVTSFCAKHGIKVVDMDGFYKPVGRSKRFFKKVKNFSRFHVDMFISIIDRQLQELNDRFDEVNTELLLCMASFNPIDSFAAYDKENLVKLAQFYPKDFTETELLHLPFQLTLFINFVRRDERFKNVKNLVELSTMLVATKKHTAYELVYKLLKLVLILPVATASVERVFSSMNYVKNKLRNRMGEQYLNDCLVTFLERDLFVQVTNDDIISRFQAMATRKVKL